MRSSAVLLAKPLVAAPSYCWLYRVSVSSDVLSLLLLASGSWPLLTRYLLSAAIDVMIAVAAVVAAAANVDDWCFTWIRPVQAPPPKTTHTVP